MNGGSSAPYLARTPCIPLFCTLFYRGGNRRAFRLTGEGGDHFHCTVAPSPGHNRCREPAVWQGGSPPSGSKNLMHWGGNALPDLHPQRKAVSPQAWRICVRTSWRISGEDLAGPSSFHRVWSSIDEEPAPVLPSKIR